MSRPAPTRRIAPAILLAAVALVVAGLLVGVMRWLGPDSDRDAAPVATIVSGEASPLPASPPPLAPEPSLPLAVPSGAVGVGPDVETTDELPPGLLEGRVSGRLVDLQGGPIPGATVMVMPGNEGRRTLGLPMSFVKGEPDWSRLRPTVSDADGHFEARLVDAVTPTTSTRSALPTLLAHHPSRSVVLTDCPPWRGVDLELGDVVMEPTVAITGRVVDPRGRPLAGAELIAAQGQNGATEVSTTDWRLLRWLLRATSGEDGRFALSGWSEQRLDLDVSCAGHVRQIVPVAHGFAQHDLGDVVLEPAGQVFGRVVDGSGAPLPGVEVVARPALASAAWGGEDTVLRDHRLQMTTNGMAGARTRTDAEGAFRFPSLPQGPFDVLAADDLHEPAGARNVHFEAAPLELVLDDAATLLVRVVSARDGTPLPGALGTAHRLSGEAGTDSFHGSLDPALPVLTGAEAARASGLPEDTSGLVFVRQAGPFGTRLRVEGLGHGAREVRLPGVEPPARAEHVVRLPPESRLVGRVLDGKGRPLAGATVQTSPETSGPLQPRQVEAVTGADGAFVLGGLEAGTWSYTHSMAGRSAGSPGQVSLAEGETFDLGDLRLFLAAALTGLVLQPDGSPASGVNVTVTPIRHPQTEVARTTSNGLGRFAFPGMQPGRWFVQAAPGGLAQASLSPGQKVDVTLQLQTRALVEGRVFDEAGPVARAVVRALRQSDGGPVSAVGGGDELVRSDGQGRFEVELPAGTYVLVARGRGKISGPADVTLHWGERRKADLSFFEGSLEGRVSAAQDGAPLHGLVVRPRLLREDGQGTYAGPAAPGTTRTDADGRFTMTGLPPGRWQIDVLPRAGAGPVGTAVATVGGRAVTRVEVTVPSR